jgi:uncharacterized membrane protein
MRKTIAKAVTWRLIGTAEIFAISFWTTGHLATAGHTAGIAAITSIVMYVVHELAWEAGTRESLYWDDPPARGLIPDLVSSDVALEQTKALARAEPD